MKLYDDALRRLAELLPGPPSKRADYREELCAPEGEKDRFLFGSETAYELGGGGKRSAAAVIFTDGQEPRSETLLYGPDLAEISSDAHFGHVTVVNLKDADEETLTGETLKTIGFTVFQLYPEGYHVRVSPAACKEQARVAKSALTGERPLSFINVGSSLIREFLRREEVGSIRTVYITDPAFDYTALSALAARVKKITDAVQSTLQLDGVDCASCAMKAVCDEIDGLRELHFRKEGYKR